MEKLGRITTCLVAILLDGACRSSPSPQAPNTNSSVPTSQEASTTVSDSSPYGETDVTIGTYDSGASAADTREAGVVIYDSGEIYQTCRALSDCPATVNVPGIGSASWTCIEPYLVQHCGPSSYLDGLPGVCTNDSQCRAGTVCRVDPTTPIAVRGPTGLNCAPPCATDSDCLPTDKCAGDGHCLGRTCAECPSFFSCESDVCVRTTCLTDSDCPGGYCVTGYCAVSLGTCRLNCM